MQQALENFERVFVALELEQDLGRGREVSMASSMYCKRE